MLQTIREKSQGWIATVILGFVCFTFALWGIHYYLNQSEGSNIVAKINGTKISEQFFNNTLRNVQQQAQEQMGADYSTDPAVQNQLKQQALSQIINTEVIVQTLRKDGFYASQEQVNAILTSVPAFQENGQFSPTRYQQVLAQMSMNTQQFLEQIQQQVMLSQLQNGIAGSDFALPNDINNAFHLMKQTRDVGYMVINTQDIKNLPAISTDAAQAYYQSHQKEFTLPPKVSLDYVVLSLDELKQNVVVTDEEAMAYYQSNPGQANNKPYNQVASQIKATLANQMAEKQFASDSESLANLAYENPSSLQAVAKQLKLQVQTTAFFAKGEKGQGILQYPQIIQAAFNEDVYQNGYNSDVISISPTEQAVVRINHKVAEKLQPFEQVQAKIEAMLAQQQQQQAAQDLAKKVATELASGKAGEEIAKSYKLSWHEKENVDRHQTQVDPKVLMQVFQMQKPASVSHPSTQVITLPSGNFAAVALYSVTPGDATTMTPAQKQSFAKVIGGKYGDVSYQLYVESIHNKAKIKTYVDFNQTDNQGDFN